MPSAATNGDAYDAIAAMAEKLRLTRTAVGYRELLETAARENLSHGQMLERVLSDELAWRHERLVARLIREAHFPAIKTIDTFDWRHPTAIPQSLILHALEPCAQQADQVLRLPPVLFHVPLREQLGEHVGAPVQELRRRAALLGRIAPRSGEDHARGRPRVDRSRQARIEV